MEAATTRCVCNPIRTSTTSAPLTLGSASSTPMDVNGPLSPPLTASTKNFRESIHLIPPLKREERPKSYEPPQLKLWVILPASLLMMSLGIALEAALAVSQKNSGYNVPEKNVFSFLSVQFLTSFFPIILVAPLALLWESKGWLVKRYQPYINMSRGETKAEDSLLLDYISVNSLYCIFLSFSKRHWLVFISAVAGFVTLLFQPLAGSIFEITQVPASTQSTVQSTRQLGLDPNRFQLTAFLAAAGYVLAAVSDGLPDPPFVHVNWTTADFEFPTGKWLNGSVLVNTTGVRTNATCTAPTSLQLDTNTGTTNYTITSQSSSNCNITVPFNPRDANQQYGVSGVPNCGPNASMNQTFWPVFFWFYRNNSGTPQAAGTFCAPTLEVFAVSANASMSDGSLGEVTIIAPISDSANNNVTGVPQMGIPFNGVIFDQPPDAFTAARATAINNGVPGAISQAVQTNVTLANAFDSLDGFVELTSRIYTQHLALVAKNTYLLPENRTIDAVAISLKPRLRIEPLSAHALSVILIIVGGIMFVVGIVHDRVRKGVFLGAPPGSIASATALTSHSGFGMFLVPYDDEASIAAKLAPLRFHLDQRTGAIVASDAPEYYPTRSDDSDHDENEKDLARGSMVRAGSSTSAGSNEETRMSLLRHGHQRSSTLSPLTNAGYSVEPFTPPPRSPEHDERT